jgi:hypothetical protein
MRERSWWEWFAITMIAATLWAIFNRAQVKRWMARRRFERMDSGPTPPIPPEPPDPNGPALADALKAAGFFEDLPLARAAELAAEVRRNGYGAVFAHDWRAFHADDEELAEGFVSDVLKSAAPAFEILGLAPLEGASRFEEGGAHHFDIVNGPSWELMSRAEAERDEPGQQRGLSWGLVGARLLGHLNQRVADTGRDDRFYSVYGGNDAHVLVLTPRMVDALQRHAGAPASQLPYLRTETWPHFGAPQ